MADDPLLGFPVTIALPVQWGEMDAFEHVNNAVYLRWVESARIAYGREIGLHELMASDRLGPILASIRCDYRRPIAFPDSVRVGSRMVRVGRTSLTLEHRVVSESAGLAAEATSVVVLYAYNEGRPRPIPEGIREAIRRLEGKAT